MVQCLYNDIENCECGWNGSETELVSHMVQVHEVFSYSTSFNNKILLELVLDLECSGCRFVILEFLKDNQEVTSIFEETYDEISKLFKLTLRSTNYPGTNYKIVLQGKSSSISYTGQMAGIDKTVQKDCQDCLQVHQAQLQRFAYIENCEVMYKVMVSIE